METLRSSSRSAVKLLPMMKIKAAFFLLPLLLLSACGVSDSQKEKMTEDFRTKITALYLRPGVPAVVEGVECSDFETKDDGFSCFATVTLYGDSGKAYLYLGVWFDKNGHVSIKEGKLDAVPLNMTMLDGGLVKDLDSHPYIIPELK